MPNYYKNENHDYLYNSKNSLKIVTNEKYGYRQLDPLPKDDEIEDIYKNQFANTVRSHFLSKKEQDRFFWRNANLRKSKIIEKLLNTKTKKNEKRRVLDIGCGVGLLLEDFKEWGWDVFGIEPAGAFESILGRKQIPYSNKLFNSIPEHEIQSLGKFDFINMTNVLEHVLEPVKLCQIAKTLLKPGGILCIESPNELNDLQLIAQNESNINSWWIQPLHINYFDRVSLENIMKYIKLNPVYAGAQFPMEFFLLFGKNYVRSEEIGRECHKMRVGFENALHNAGAEDLLIDIYESFAKLGVGRIIAVYGRNENG